MKRDPGVWTSEDCAFVLIDYEKEMFEPIRSEASAELGSRTVRGLSGCGTPARPRPERRPARVVPSL